MMMRRLIWLLIWACPIALSAQTSGDCGAYDRLVAEAEAAAQSGNYSTALKKYNAAKVCRPDATQTIDEAILDVFNRIQGERNRALAAEREAVAARARAIEEARINALKDKAAQITGIALDISATDPEVALRLLQAAFDSVEYNSLFALRTMHEMLDDQHHKIPAKTIEGHNDYVRSLTFSPDGNRIVSTSDDGSAIMWNLDGEKLHEYRGYHNGYVRCATISPDGQKLITGGDDGKVVLWDINGDTIRIYDGHIDWVQDVDWSPDGESFLSASDDGRVIHWNLQGDTIRTFTGHDDYVYCAKFAPDGQSIAAGSTNGTTILWNLKGEKLNEIRPGLDYAPPVNSLAFLPGGDQILTASGDGIVRMWDISEPSKSTIQQAERIYQGHEDAVTFLSMDPGEGVFIAGGLDGKVTLWTLEGELIRTFTHGSPLLGGAISPANLLVVSAGYTGELKLWEGYGYKYQYSYSVSEPVLAVAVSPDGKYYATGHESGTAFLWDQKGQRVQEFSGHSDYIRSIDFSPDGQQLLTGSDDALAIRWDLNGKQLTRYVGHLDYIRDARFSPDGQQILTGSDDGRATLWNLEGDTIRSFIGHLDYVRGVAFSPDGTKVLTGSDDQAAIIWDRNTGDTIRVLLGHSDWIRSVAFSPDGNSVLTGSDDGSAILWSLEGNILQRLDGEHDGYVLTVAFSPDGQQILTGGDDGLINLWNINGELLHTLREHSSEINSVVFSPDGNNIISGSLDGSVKIWDRQGNFLHNLEGESVSIHTGGWSDITVFSKAALYALSSAPDGVLLWDFRGKTINQYLCQGREVTSIATSSTGPEVLLGLNDGAIEAFHIQTADSLYTYTGHEAGITEIDYAIQGEYFVSGSADSTARLWSPSSAEALKTLEHPGPVWNVAISDDGSTIVSSCEGSNKIFVWNRDGRLLREIESASFGRSQVAAKVKDRGYSSEAVETLSSNSVTDVDISSDGNLILIGNADGKAQIWTRDGELVNRLSVPGLNGAQMVAFSPDDEFIVTASEYFVYLWHNQGNLHPIQTFRFDTPINSINFSSDGRSILVGDQYIGFHRLRNLLWDLYNGDNIRELTEEDLQGLEQLLSE